jgi:primosomal replication protein N
VHNQVRLSATVSAREALRHTPAGVPILTFTLKHDSSQSEGGIPRQVGFEIDAMAVGAMAQQMNSVQAGQQVNVAGFLTSRSRMSMRLVLHVNQFELA